MRNFFEMVNLDDNGQPIGVPVTCKTVTGVILNSPIAMDNRTIEHLCEIARTTADYPVDMVAFLGEGEHKRVVWQARIYWRGETYPVSPFPQGH